MPLGPRLGPVCSRLSVALTPHIFGLAVSHFVPFTTLSSRTLSCRPHTSFSRLLDLAETVITLASELSGDEGATPADKRKFAKVSELLTGVRPHLKVLVDVLSALVPTVKVCGRMAVCDLSSQCSGC
jgi:hypothetical protein